MSKTTDRALTRRIDSLKNNQLVEDAFLPTTHVTLFEEWLQEEIGALEEEEFLLSTSTNFKVMQVHPSHYQSGRIGDNDLAPAAAAARSVLSVWVV